MKLFLVRWDKCNYDEYDGFVIWAKNKREAKKIALSFKNVPNDKPKITKISEPKKPKIILSSFKAG
jgi:hypothetical protein